MADIVGFLHKVQSSKESRFAATGISPTKASGFSARLRPYRLEDLELNNRIDAFYYEKILSKVI
jgi:hypothetical protein